MTVGDEHDAIALDPVACGARWITSAAHRADATVLPVLATRFRTVGGSLRATLRIAALGVLRASIDGRPVSADVLEPGYADWRRVAEWVEYDVSALVVPGTHVLRIDLGGGMVRSQEDDERWVKVRSSSGDLAVAAVLDIVEGDGRVTRVTTDDAWRSISGAVVVSGWVGGETYDAEREPDASPAGLERWDEAVVAKVPQPLALVRKRTLPVRVQETLPARRVTGGNGTWVIDFGVNAAGWPVIDLPARSRVRLRPAELLIADESGVDHPVVDVRTQGWGPVHHDVRTGADPMTWRPSFMYNGLRYLEVTGLPEPPTTAEVRLEVLSADAPVAGGMSTSDERVDSILALVVDAVRSNMFSVFTDCPQREKLGYLEQAHALHDLLVRLHACDPILDWTLDLALDAQRADGSIGLYVPEWEEFPDPWRGDPNWGGALLLLPLRRWRQTGDVHPLRRSMPAVRRYLAFLLSERDAAGLVQYGLGDFDGKSVREFRDVAFVSTATLHKLLLVAADVADVLGDADGDELRASAREVARDFRRAFAHDDGTFGPRTVTAHTIALDARLAPPELLDVLEAQIVAAEYVLDIGAVALALLVEHLAAGGRHRTLWAITRVTDQPSYGYMLAHGATTLTETWDGPTFGFSQNHFMFGAIATWFLEHLAGIRRAPRSVGWTDVLIAPVPVGSLTHVTSWYDAPTGRIESSWRIEQDSFLLEGVAPAAAGAVAVLPSGARHPVSGRFALSESWPSRTAPAAGDAEASC